MTKQQKQQDLREALWEASRVLREKQSALERFLPVRPLGEELLKPTRIYVSIVQGIIERFSVKGIAHITGGGFITNIPRIIPEDLTAAIDSKTWTCPPIFKIIGDCAKLNTQEMFGTFNMGIGMVVVVDAKQADTVIKWLESEGEQANIIGEFEDDAISFEEAMNTLRDKDNADIYNGVHDEQIEFVAVEEVKA